MSKKHRRTLFLGTLEEIAEEITMFYTNVDFGFNQQNNNHFPSVDFALVDVEDNITYTNEELNDIFKKAFHWYGIHRFNSGFDSTMEIACNYYEGGCGHYVEIINYNIQQEILDLMIACVSSNEGYNPNWKYIAEIKYDFKFEKETIKIK